MMRKVSQRFLRQLCGWVLLLITTAWLSSVGTQLYRHARQPVDAVLVLGGSIQREIAIANTVAEGNDLPILISHGAEPPCTRIIFDRVGASVEHVWLEPCAESTFDNYRYSLPVLENWHTTHVKVITSPTHMPRAAWLARILLGSHGIWPEMELVEEVGIPGNTESRVKTGLDVARSLGWAIVSQFYHPPCKELMPLAAVDLEAWNERGFKCERQANIESPS